MNKISMTIAAVLFSATSAVATTFNPIVIESNGNRPGAGGDITSTLDLGVIAPNTDVGIAGRIVTAVDTWSFETLTPWSISFVDLPIDDQQFFDSSDITNPAGNFASNGDTTSAIFSIFEVGNATALFSQEITATDGGVGTENLLNFSGLAGSFILEIDGQPGSPGATYDIGISSVPLPAAAWLLLAGVGGLSVMKRRRKDS
ncbi:MAG: VPLPA-CTERM sorting domain-containing protein [Pseudomonadota bacterium]